MIRLRLPEPPPELVDKGAVELAKARVHFGNVANDGEPFAFAAYKLGPVKDALNATFGFKCAYCESFFGATQPLDVEHFRPKSGVLVDGDLVWGVYYWLAASWGNLLPSCTDCNRPRKQSLPDGSEQTLGKANQFPIASEAKRATTEGEEKAESRLLVHPCLDHPETHFVFEPDGIVSWRSRKGKESVRVYALLRRGLVQARQALQVEVLTHITVAKGLARKLDHDGPDALLESLLQTELEALARFMEPTHPYSATARALIEPVLEELTG
jgi:5-methylcytosine-specific restriction endonuclease McrA